MSIINPTELYYYVSVTNNRTMPAMYTLAARQYERMLGSGVFYLTANQPLVSVAVAGWYAFYAFYCDGAWPTVQINVDVIKGDPDIYVNKNSSTNGYTYPSSGQYTDVSNNVGSDNIIITRPSAGYIYISVYSWGTQDSLFRITVTGEGRLNLMYSGSTYTATIAANRSMYYSLAITPAQINYANAQLVIALTAPVGNPDLYVSDTWQFPNATHSNWSSAMTGVLDTIVLTNRTVGRERPALHNGTYYIAVHSNNSVSRFSLQALLGDRVQLRDGITQVYYLYSGNGQMMEVSYDRDTPFHISSILTSGTGPVYLYVSFNEDISPTQPSSYMWSGVQNSTSQEVEISGEGCTTATCKYYIYVWAPYRTSIVSYNVFSIVAHTATTALLLTPGVEVTDGAISGAGNYKHYYFELACPNNTVSLFLTAITGNPDLFVLKGNNFPTRQMFNWSSDNTGLANDVIQFTQADQRFRGTSMAGRYSVSVQGTTQGVASYRLVLSVQSSCGDATTIPLENGQPQYGRVMTNSWQYYTFTITYAMWPTSVTFVLSPTDASNPDMYVTKDGRTPTQDIYSWKAEADAGFDDIIGIRNGSTNPSPCVPTAATPCVYRVAVYSRTVSSYTLTASTTGTLLGLLLETSRDGYVSPGGWQQYVVQVTDTYQPLVFICSPLAGNPDLYIEYDKPATLNSLTSKTAGVDVITIPQPDAGRWYIGIHGAGDTANYYSIVASQRGIQLRNGRPQDDVLSTGEIRYYVFEFDEPIGLSRAFRLQIDSISFNPQLEVYIRRTQVPSATNNEGSQISANGDSMHFFINSTDPRWRRTTTWRVMVVSRSVNAAFSITAAVGAAPIYLSDGRPTDVGEMVTSGEIRYFRLLVLGALYPVHIAVNVVSGGNVTAFISLTEPLPGPDTALLMNRSYASVAGSVSVEIPRTMLRPGYVYVGV